MTTRYVTRNLQLFFLLISTSLPYAHAGDLKLNGFLTAVAGTVLDGSRDTPVTSNYQIECPCVNTDWANNGVYQGSDITATPDSKAGIQARYKATNSLSFTGQLTARGTAPMPALTWAYATYNLDEHWGVDIGRKRIPLYFYSDFQDVGFAYPWITPPGELYGWDATNYNGASVHYSTNLHGYEIKASAFGGQEKVINNPYFESFQYESVNNSWKHLLGTDLEISKDWWTLRMVYAQAAVEAHYKLSDFYSNSDMKAYGVAFNGDFDNWFFLTEVGSNDRKYHDDTTYTVKAPAYGVGVGYRWGGNWTAFANHGYYRERSDDLAYPYVRYGTTSLTLRYNLDAHSDIKVQLDKHKDDSVDYTGDSNLLRVSYDRVF